MRSIAGVGTAMGVTAMAVAVGACVASAQEPEPVSLGGGDCAASVYNCADTPNPLPPTDEVWMERMTWMDVRDALRSGVTTVIIPTGGMEPNGPWLATGKHNYVLRANCEAIARELGDAVCAPIVKWVPEGGFDPPTGHMRSPGTLSLRQETFRALLTDVAHSLKMHGFRNIVFIGDSGGNQGGQRDVAEALNARWDGTVVAQVREYYDYAAVERYMAYSAGLEEGENEGLHDDIFITLNMLAADPASVRYDERVRAGLASINGVSIEDRVRSLELAREIVVFRAESTAEAIRTAIADGGSAAAPPRPPRPASAAARPRAPRQAPDPRTMGGGDCRRNAYNCSDTPNPLPAGSTLWLEEMTWMDVRDALAAGKRTVIVATGGIEPNGPWLVTGKHNYVLHANCPVIARELGDALCAPILPFVPEGSIEPQSGHMRSPGTISIRQETFDAVLTDVARSLRVHGFEHIVFIGDSGGNRRGMERVAETLGAEWGSDRSIFYVPEYYGWVGQHAQELLGVLGVASAGRGSDGLHDNPTITLNMLFDDPSSVRWAERVAARQAVIDGVSIASLGASFQLGERISLERSRFTARAIRSRLR